MTAKKAVEILTHYCSKDARCYDPDLYDSVQVSIEALEARIWDREHGYIDLDDLLPGETKE